jgi:hypothetical protein
VSRAATSAPPWLPHADHFCVSSARHASGDRPRTRSPGIRSICIWGNTFEGGGEAVVTGGSHLEGQTVKVRTDVPHIQGHTLCVKSGICTPKPDSPSVKRCIAPQPLYSLSANRCLDPTSKAMLLMRIPEAVLAIVTHVSRTRCPVPRMPCSCVKKAVSPTINVSRKRCPVPRRPCCS